MIGGLHGIEDALGIEISLSVCSFRDAVDDAHDGICNPSIGECFEDRFDTASDPPTIQMRTFSTYYGTYSGDLPTYADWYREHEQPGMTDAEFHAAEEFDLPLSDFRERFGAPRP